MRFIRQNCQYGLLFGKSYHTRVCYAYFVLHTISLPFCFVDGIWARIHMRPSHAHVCIWTLRSLLVAVMCVFCVCFHTENHERTVIYLYICDLKNNTFVFNRTRLHKITFVSSAFYLITVRCEGKNSFILRNCQWIWSLCSCACRLCALIRQENHRMNFPFCCYNDARKRINRKNEFDSSIEIQNKMRKAYTNDIESLHVFHRMPWLWGDPAMRIKWLGKW